MYQATFEIKSSDKKLLRSIYQAILPDNINLPNNIRKKLNVETKLEKDKIVIYILCKEKIETLHSTIDDLLRCLQVIEKLLSKT